MTDLSETSEMLITARASDDERSPQGVLIDLKRYRLVTGEGPLDAAVVATIGEATAIFERWLLDFAAHTPVTPQ